MKLEDIEYTAKQNKISFPQLVQAINTAEKIIDNLADSDFADKHGSAAIKTLTDFKVDVAVDIVQGMKLPPTSVRRATATEASDIAKEVDMFFAGDKFIGEYVSNKDAHYVVRTSLIRYIGYMRGLTIYGD